MGSCDIRRLGFLLVLVLFIFSAPSSAAGITVTVPETDIVGKLKVQRCEINRSDNNYMRGCHIEINFLRVSGDDSIAEENLRWLQLVSTNEPALTDDSAQFVQFIDQMREPTSHFVGEDPFYWPRVDLHLHRSDSALFFGDMPATDSWYYGWDEFEWYDGWTIKNQFELYLVRELDKAIQVLAKITWGYQVDTRGVVVLYQPHLQNQNVPSQILEETLAEEFPDWSLTATASEDGNIAPSGDDGEIDDGDGGGGGGCFIGAVVNGHLP